MTLPLQPDLRLAAAHQIANKDRAAVSVGPHLCTLSGPLSAYRVILQAACFFRIMVVDPFSIAGAVGLAAGLIGFMASTIERTAGTIDTAKHTSSRLKTHDLSLRTCQQRLKEWARQWHGRLGRSREQELRFLWGN